MEEDVGRIVGRRKIRDPLALDSIRREDAIAWSRAFGGLRIPRGVYRFRTHAEADEWLWRMMARPTSR